MVLCQPVLCPSCWFISQAVCLFSWPVQLVLIEGTCEKKVLKIKSLINLGEGVENMLSTARKKSFSLEVYHFKCDFSKHFSADGILIQADRLMALLFEVLQTLCWKEKPNFTAGLILNDFAHIRFSILSQSSCHSMLMCSIRIRKSHTLIW